MTLLLFDLDGTLYSSRGILPAAYRQGIREFNRDFEPDVDVPTEEEIFDQVGKPAPEIYENLFPALTAEQSAELQKRIFGALLERIKNREGRLYDGVQSGLETLAKRYPIGLVTNAQTAYMEAVLETHDLRQYFGRTLCHDDAPNGRKAELVEMTLRHFGMSESESLMIGDRRSDYEAAETHGVPFIHCGYGYGNHDDFPESPRIESFGELLDGDLLPDPDDADTELTT